MFSGANTLAYCVVAVMTVIEAFINLISVENFPFLYIKFSPKNQNYKSFFLHH
jgi:hypothetical protein